MLRCRDCGLTVHKQCQGKISESCKPVTPPPEPAEQSPTQEDNAMDMSGVEEALPSQAQSPKGKSRRPPRRAPAESEEGGTPLPLMSISASIKRKNKMAQDAKEAQRTGWMVCFTSRDAPHQKYFWRVDTRAILMHDSDDPKSPVKLEVLLDNVVAVEEAVPLSPNSQKQAEIPSNPTPNDMPHVFTIRMPSQIYYCGEDPTFYRRKTDRCDMQRGSGREYGLQWMKRIRELCTVLPSIGDTVNIRDLYNIHHDQVLGSGQFGVVYLATSKKDGKVVALKVIDAARIEKQKLLPEIRILKSIHHPGIVGLVDFYDTAQKIYVIMERLERE